MLGVDRGQYISFAEATAILKNELKFPEERAIHFVKRFDHNKDGRLSAGEFTQFKKRIEDTYVYDPYIRGFVYKNLHNLNCALCIIVYTVQFLSAKAQIPLRRLSSKLSHKRSFGNSGIQTTRWLQQSSRRSPRTLSQNRRNRIWALKN